MTIPDWKNLIQKACKGDSDSQSQLISLTQNKVFQFCYYLSGRRELAEDLCQEVYIKALSHLHQLKDPEAFQAWLYQMAKNLFLDHQKSYPKKEILMMEPLEGRFSDSKIETSLQIQKALSQIETEDRILLLLVDLQEYSYAETAQILHMSEDAVRSKLHRVRQEFLKIIKKTETKP